MQQQSKDEVRARGWSFLLAVTSLQSSPFTTTQDASDLTSILRAHAHPAGSPERLYTVRYLVDAGGLKGHHQYLYEHPNGLFVLGLGKQP